MSVQHTCDQAYSYLVRWCSLDQLQLSADTIYSRLPTGVLSELLGAVYESCKSFSAKFHTSTVVSHSVLRILQSILMTHSPAFILIWSTSYCARSVIRIMFVASCILPVGSTCCSDVSKYVGGGSPAQRSRYVMSNRFSTLTESESDNGTTVPSLPCDDGRMRSEHVNTCLSPRLARTLFFTPSGPYPILKIHALLRRNTFCRKTLERCCGRSKS